MTVNLKNNLMYWYRKISQINIKDTKDSMEDSINIFQPIHIYFKRNNNAIKFSVDGKMPYMTKKIFHTVYH